MKTKKTLLMSLPMVVALAVPMAVWAQSATEERAEHPLTTLAVTKAKLQISLQQLTVLAHDEPVRVSSGLLEDVCSEVENTVSHGSHCKTADQCWGHRRTEPWTSTIVVTP